MNDNQVTFPSITFFKCNHCETFFKSKPSRSRHVRKMHPNKLMCQNKRNTYPCTYNSCNHVSKSRSAKRNHEIKDHEKTFGCEICDKYFGNNRSLKNHCKKFHSDMYCTICDIPLFDEKQFEEHLYKLHQS